MKIGHWLAATVVLAAVACGPHGCEGGYDRTCRLECESVGADMVRRNAFGCLCTDGTRFTECGQEQVETIPGTGI